MPIPTEKLIRVYYENRQLKCPTSEQALLWALTELGEATEQLLAKDQSWVRNHPEKHLPYTPEMFSEELGDAIFMLMVSGMAAGMNPLKSLHEKLERLLQEK